MARLTERQRRFVEAYTGEAQGNATEAARIAGYSGDDGALAVRGAELVRNRKVAEVIEEATAEVRSQAIADREERQCILTEIARGEATEYHVSKEGDVTETPTNPPSRIRAAELLGKMQGDFVERHEVEHSGTAAVVFYPDNGRVPEPQGGGVSDA